MNERELKALCERAAWAVTGKNVTVRLVAPVIKQFDGETYNAPGGSYIINIKPDLTDENFLWVFTHELGHVQLGHISDTNPNWEPGSRKLSPAGELSIKVNPEIAARENGATDLGAKWLQYAEDNYHAYSGFTKLERQLRALCAYLKPDYLEHARNIGFRAGLKAAEFEMWKRTQERKGR